MLDHIVQLLIGVALAFNCWQVWRLSAEVAEIQRQTNGITAALIMSTAKASLAEGNAAGLAQGRREERK